MSVQLFLDYMSQPSRAVYIFLKVNQIPIEICPVALRKGEHLTEHFKEKFSRFGKVPFIHDGDFKLNESVAIVRYMAKVNNIDNNWYPIDSKQQARIDEYLEWQHNNTRAFCSAYVVKKWMKPLVTGKETPADVLKIHEDKMNACLDEIENVWLKNSLFMCGGKISVADIFAACEIEETRLAGVEARKGRPRLGGWLDRVRATTNPFYDEAHRTLYKVVASNKARAKL